MSDLIRKMTQAYLKTTFGPGYGNNIPVDPAEMEAMRAALAVMADHFDNGVYVVTTRTSETERAADIGVFIAAAIRSAIREAGK